MASMMVRLDRDIHAKLREWSNQENKTISQVVTDLVEAREKEAFWEEMRAGYERLRADPEAWQEYQDEIKLWDTTSSDGFEQGS